MNYLIFRSFDNYIYANILLLRLKSEGIDCYIKDENTITIDPLLSPAIGGMKLMVNESDLVRATNLLEEFELEQLKTLACPNCGSASIQRIIKNRNPSNFISGFLSSLINGSPDSKIIIYRCVNCGFKIDDLSAISQKDF